MVVSPGGHGARSPRASSPTKQRSAPSQTDPLHLVVDLTDGLRAAGVSYCHWKSNDALHLSASGVNDLDLLVDRRSLQRLLEVLVALGFKQARPHRSRQVPGVLHYFGLDERSGRLVHVDLQAQLVVGDDTTKNVHLPLEEAYLASCTPGTLFPVPAPEFELAVLVVRLALKHATWDAAAFGLGGLKAAERRELDHLLAGADRSELRRVVERHLPQVGWSAWSRYCDALAGGAPFPRQLAAGRRVVRRTRSLTRTAPALDAAVRCGRRVHWGLRHYLLGRRNTKRLMAGGRVIAVVGGDGAGKSTLVRGLAGWLQGPLETRVLHMGKPPRSPATVLVKGGVYTARRLHLLGDWLPNYPTPQEHGDRRPSVPWLLWQLVTASDRSRQYRRVGRLAARGYVVVCDRFPLEQVRQMDGSRTGWVHESELSPVARRLVRAERARYAAIGRPDVLLVLRVDPDTAVDRKQGVDPAEFVRPRSAEVFALDWRDTGAHLLDATRSAEAVLADARATVWANL
jgi:thymidylate kinase